MIGRGLAGLCCGQICPGSAFKAGRAAHANCLRRWVEGFRLSDERRQQQRMPQGIQANRSPLKSFSLLRWLLIGCVDLVFSARARRILKRFRTRGENFDFVRFTLPQIDDLPGHLRRGVRLDGVIHLSPAIPSPKARPPH